MRSGHLLIAAAISLAVQPASAALPPKYQRLNELRAILDHPGVVNAFDTTQLIDRIEHIRPGLYRVSAGACRLDVAIVGRPQSGPPMPGAGAFDVEPRQRVCSKPAAAVR